MRLKNFSIILIISVFYIFTTACSGTSPDGSGMTTSDVTISVTPSNNQKAIPTNLDSVVVTFSDRINSESISAQSVSISPQINFTIDTSNLDASRILIINLNTELLPNTNYTVYLTGVIDSNGVALPNKTWTFTTASLNEVIPPAADTTAPSIPGNFRFTNISANSVTVAWDASSDNVGVSGYRVYRNDTLLTTSTSLSYAHNGLSAGGSYTFRVDAIDAAGNISSSNTLTVTLVSNSTASLSWSAPTQNTDNSSLTNLSGFVIYYGLSPASLVNRIQVGSGDRSATIQNLQAGMTYYFAISAVNSEGAESDLSNIVSKSAI